MSNAIGSNGVTDRFDGGGLDSGIIDDNATSGWMDVASMRMAWGRADSILGTPEFFSFAVPFGKPPVVQITRGSDGAPLVARQVSTTGFVIDRADLNPNPIPFTWTATGITAETVAPPSTLFNVVGLPTWSAAVRAQRAGKRNARLLCIGDSTTAGHGAYASGLSTNDRAGAWPTAICSLLTARGSFASWSSVVGSANAPNISQYDARVTFGAGIGYSYAIGNQVLGAYTFRTLNGTGKLNFAPFNQCDTFEFYSLQRQLSGTTALITSINDVDKTTVTCISDNANPGYFVKTTVTAALGLNVFNARANQSETNEAHFAGIIGYNSAVKEITVLNAGWSGAKAGDFNNLQTTAWSPIKSIAAYNPDLTIINLGINDFNQATPTGRQAWFDNMQAIITACKASGSDVILVIPNDIGGTYAATFASCVWFVNYMAQVNGLKVIDLRDKLGTYTAANAAGYMRDILHPNSTGYALIAEAIADVIMPAS